MILHFNLEDVQSAPYHTLWKYLDSFGIVNYQPLLFFVLQRRTHMYWMKPLTTSVAETDIW